MRETKSLSITTRFSAKQTKFFGAMAKCSLDQHVASSHLPQQCPSEHLADNSLTDQQVPCSTELPELEFRL